MPLDSADEGNYEWLKWHGCNPVKDGDHYNITIPVRCSQLEDKDGVLSCKIYETRPKICRDYTCQTKEEV